MGTSYRVRQPLSMDVGRGVACGLCLRLADCVSSVNIIQRDTVTVADPYTNNILRHVGWTANVRGTRLM